MVIMCDINIILDGNLLRAINGEGFSCISIIDSEFEVIILWIRSLEYKNSVWYLQTLSFIN